MYKLIINGKMKNKILPNKDAVIMELSNLNQLKVYSVTYVKV